MSGFICMLGKYPQRAPMSWYFLHIKNFQSVMPENGLNCEQ